MKLPKESTEKETWGTPAFRWRKRTHQSRWSKNYKKKGSRESDYAVSCVTLHPPPPLLYTSVIIPIHTPDVKPQPP